MNIILLLAASAMSTLWCISRFDSHPIISTIFTAISAFLFLLILLAGVTDAVNYINAILSKRQASKEATKAKEMVEQTKSLLPK